jgi:hypothetical protein
MHCRRNSPGPAEKEIGLGGIRNIESFGWAWYMVTAGLLSLMRTDITALGGFWMKNDLFYFTHRIQAFGTLQQVAAHYQN